jgi:hypothetical protein
MIDKDQGQDQDVTTIIIKEDVQDLTDNNYDENEDNNNRNNTRNNSNN